MQSCIFKRLQATSYLSKNKKEQQKLTKPTKLLKSKDENAQIASILSFHNQSHGYIEKNNGEEEKVWEEHKRQGENL